MRIHVCIRSTLDWRDAARVDAGILPDFRPKLEAWNATFDMPYHRFRQRLREIAELNLSRVEGIVRSGVEAVPAGDLIVPVDDDDWFAPDLARRLEPALDPRVRCYLWTRAVIEPPRLIRDGLRRLARRLGRRELFVCQSNNYAVVSAPGLVPLALNHVQASRYVDLHPAEVVRVPATLAVQNRTLASQTTLAWTRPSIGRKELVALWRRYRCLYDARVLGSELAWARPYVGMMAALMRDIGVR